MTHVIFSVTTVLTGDGQLKLTFRGELDLIRSIRQNVGNGSVTGFGDDLASIAGHQSDDVRIMLKAVIVAVQECRYRRVQVIDPKGKKFFHVFLSEG